MKYQRRISTQSLSSTTETLPDIDIVLIYNRIANGGGEIGLNMYTPGDEHDTQRKSPSIPLLPPAPSPSADKGAVPSNKASEADLRDLSEVDKIDIFVLKPVAALKILCESLLVLVRITGDIPPTPPVRDSATPNSGMIEVEQDIVVHYSKDMRNEPGLAGEDAVPARAKTPIGSPEAHPAEALQIFGNSKDYLHVQHRVIIRKFYSKKPPPIALEEYLTRLHKYCPMSTAVYLATSLYIYRLAVIEKILPVTARNVHRLVLAGLRVASKALDDLVHSHTRFAKVGGVTEKELGRLEVCFCFVTDFALKVDKDMLLYHAEAMRDGIIALSSPATFQPKLPSIKERRTLVVGQKKPTTFANAKAPPAMKGSL